MTEGETVRDPPPASARKQTKRFTNYLQGTIYQFVERMEYDFTESNTRRCITTGKVKEGEELMETMIQMNVANNLQELVFKKTTYR